jgi:LPXTG-motif cell wall-anchored protein
LVVVSGNDDPGALGYLIVAARAVGLDPTSFGTTHINLVARLQATKQASGLFGANDPSFDGAFRQGLALLGLHAVGLTDADAVSWLVDQQCDDGLWVPFRADTSVACPAVDPATFSGPDTNTTALAIIGLHAVGGAPGAVTDGVNALGTVRNAGGAWGYLASDDQPTDANSTGLVVEALHAVNGGRDAQGTAALLALQVGCAGDPADVGAIAFQPGGGGELVPNAYATVQAIPALAGATRPIIGATIANDLPDVCHPPAPTTTTTVRTAAAAAGATTTTTTPVATGVAELPRTGSDTGVLTLAGAALVGAGLVLGRRARRAVT